MKTWKPWILNVATIVVMGLFLVAQGVGARPDAEPAAPAAPSQTVISYQGTLTDPGGNPINGTVTMEFALYDAATGGNRLWGPETQTVEVSDGLFHVLLGSVEAMDPDKLSGDLYLDIKVNEEEMSPRELLTSVAFAVEASALSAKDIMAQVKGKLTFADSNGSRYPSNWIGMANNIGDNKKWLHIGGITDDDGIRRTTYYATKHYFNGNVGVGTRNPAAKLDVNGNMELRGGLDMNGHSVTNCGALTEANLQTEEELAAGGIDRFKEGDVLCWAGERLETCSTAGDPLVQAVADAEGRPIVIGAELVKVLGPVRYGDLLGASDAPGYAMVDNDPRPGTVIAQALEDFEGEMGIIKAMIRKF